MQINKCNVVENSINAFQFNKIWSRVGGDCKMEMENWKTFGYLKKIYGFHSAIQFTETYEMRTTF